ncbi:MAG: hypothetical protein SOW59_04140 [Corynebacterium sp.]|nr:hypothetical protein [Corynebacterium sp.]
MPDRIIGLDIARGISIVGMVWAHLGMASISISSGFPSALFAVLAGVSVGIMSAPSQQPIPRLAIRGLLIMAIGAVLSAVQSYIAVVLVTMGALIAALGPLARRSTRQLVWLLALFTFLSATYAAVSQTFAFYNDFFAGVYPFLAWLAYGTAGLLIYRLVVYAPWSWQLGTLLASLGPVCALVWWRESKFVNATDIFGKSAVYSDEPVTMPDPLDGPQLSWNSFISPEAHSGGLGDVLASIMVALIIITSCLLLSRLRPIKALLYPVHAMGSMALSSYIIHALTAGAFVALATFGAQHEVIIGDEASLYSKIPFERYQDKTANANSWEELWDKEGAYYDSLSEPASSHDLAPEALSTPLPFWLTVLVLLGGASVWKLFFFRGPAEAALRSLEKKALTAPPLETS